jgi:hypothetical protein
MEKGRESGTSPAAYPTLLIRALSRAEMRNSQGSPVLFSVIIS